MEAALDAQSFDLTHQRLPDALSTSRGVNKHPCQFSNPRLDNLRTPAPDDPFSILDDDEKAGIAAQIIAGLIEHRLLDLNVCGFSAPVKSDNVHEESPNDCPPG